MFLSFILVFFGIFLILKLLFRNKKPGNKTLTEGKILKNKYIINHENKMKDDAEYEEYLEWCKFKGELPTDKEGFDEHRMKEYQMYKKLIKHGIKGLS